MEVEMEVGRSAQCCEGCSAACSRVVVPRFAGGAECAELCRLADAVMEADLGDTVITHAFEPVAPTLTSLVTLALALVLALALRLPPI